MLLAPLLAAGSRAAPIQDRWTGVKRVVAVGDVHGDCDALVAVLKMASLVDDETTGSAARRTWCRSVICRPAGRKRATRWTCS